MKTSSIETFAPLSAAALGSFDFANERILSRVNSVRNGPLYRTSLSRSPALSRSASVSSRVAGSDSGFTHHAHPILDAPAVNLVAHWAVEAHGHLEQIAAQRSVPSKSFFHFWKELGKFNSDAINSLAEISIINRALRAEGAALNALAPGEAAQREIIKPLRREILIHLACKAGKKLRKEERKLDKAHRLSLFPRASTRIAGAKALKKRVSGALSGIRRKIRGRRLLIRLQAEFEHGPHRRYPWLRAASQHFLKKLHNDIKRYEYIDVKNVELSLLKKRLSFLRANDSNSQKRIVSFTALAEHLREELRFVNEQPAIIATPSVAGPSGIVVMQNALKSSGEKISSALCEPLQDDPAPASGFIDEQNASAIGASECESTEDDTQSSPVSPRRSILMIDLPTEGQRPRSVSVLDRDEGYGSLEAMGLFPPAAVFAGTKTDTDQALALYPIQVELHKEQGAEDSLHGHADESPNRQAPVGPRSTLDGDWWKSERKFCQTCYDDAWSQPGASNRDLGIAPAVVLAGFPDVPEPDDLVSPGLVRKWQREQLQNAAGVSGDNNDASGFSFTDSGPSSLDRSPSEPEHVDSAEGEGRSQMTPPVPVEAVASQAATDLTTLPAAAVLALADSAHVEEQLAAEYGSALTVSDGQLGDGDTSVNDGGDDVIFLTPEKTETASQPEIPDLPQSFIEEATLPIRPTDEEPVAMSDSSAFIPSRSKSPLASQRTPEDSREPGPSASTGAHRADTAPGSMALSPTPVVFLNRDGSPGVSFTLRESTWRHSSPDNSETNGAGKVSADRARRPMVFEREGVRYSAQQWAELSLSAAAAHAASDEEEAGSPDAASFMDRGSPIRRTTMRIESGRLRDVTEDAASAVSKAPEAHLRLVARERAGLRRHARIQLSKRPLPAWAEEKLPVHP